MRCLPRGYGVGVLFGLFIILISSHQCSSYQSSMMKLMTGGLHRSARGHSHFVHLHGMKHIAKITKHLGPHIGPILGVAAGGAMTVVGYGILHSPLSPFPVPHLPLPPVGRQPIKQVLEYPGHYDIVPKGYHYLPPIQHPRYNNLEYGVYGNVGANSIWY